MDTFNSAAKEVTNMLHNEYNQPCHRSFLAHDMTACCLIVHLLDSPKHPSFNDL
jgi:hypothetical protein